MIFRAINNYPYAFALSAKQNLRLIRPFRKRSTLRFVALRVEFFLSFSFAFSGDCRKLMCRESVFKLTS